MPVEVPAEPSQEDAADANGLKASSPSRDSVCNLTAAKEGCAAGTAPAQHQPSANGDTGPISPNRPRNKALRELKHLQTDAVWQAETPDLNAGRTRRSSTAAASTDQQQPAQTAPRGPKRPRTSGGTEGAADGGEGIGKRRKSAPGGPPAAHCSNNAAPVAADAPTVIASGNAPAAEAALADAPAATLPEPQQQKRSQKHPKPRGGKRTSSGTAVQPSASMAPNLESATGDVDMQEAPSVSDPAAKLEREAPSSGPNTADAHAAASSKAAVSRPKPRSRSSKKASETGSGSADDPLAADAAASTLAAAADSTAAVTGQQAAATGVGASVPPAVGGAVPMDLVSPEAHPNAAADMPAASADGVAAGAASVAEAAPSAAPAAATQAVAVQEPVSKADPANSVTAADHGVSEASADALPVARAEACVSPKGDQPTAPAAVSASTAATAALSETAAEPSTATEPKPVVVPTQVTPEVKAEGEAEVKTETTGQSGKPEPLAVGTAGAASGHEWQSMAQGLAEKVKNALHDVPAPSGTYKIASLLRCGVLTGGSRGLG